MYATGGEFLEDMIISFGVDKALEFSKEYLMMQENDNEETGLFERDSEEFVFCKQLRQAVQLFGKQ